MNLAMLSHPIFLAVFGGFSGLCVGSFLNVVIRRVPRLLFAEPGEGKGEDLRFARISARYPVVEALTATLFAVAAMRMGMGYPWFGLCMLSSFLVALCAIDVDHLVLPDVLTFPLIGLGMAFNAGPGFVSFAAALTGAVVGYVFLWLVAKVTARVAGREALGMGDAKLLAALGAWLGFDAIVPVVVVAVALTAAWMLFMHVRARGIAGYQVPFGPSLAAGGLLVALHAY